MKINREDLLKALGIVNPGLSKKGQILQSDSFAFMQNVVATYNDEICISQPIEGLDLTCAVKADEFYKLLGKLKADEIDLELNAGELLLTCGKTKAGLRVEEEIKLPIDEIGEIGETTPVTESFLEALKFCVPVCSDDIIRPILNGIHLSSKGFVEASDGFRVAQYSIKDMELKDCVIPRTSVMDIVKLNPVEMFVGESWAHFKTGEGTMISCRVMHDQFPNTETVLQVTGKEITFPRTITEIIDRARVFSYRDKWLNEDVAISLQENKIMVEANSDNGWFKEEANMKYGEDAVVFHVSPELIRNILKETLGFTLGERMVKFQFGDWQYVACLRFN